MTTTWRFADVEALGVAYLKAATGARVVTDLPPTLDDALPLIRVARGPGSDDEVTDSPLLDVETFAASRGAARSLAEDVRTAMRMLRGQSVNGYTVDDVATASGPVFVAYSPTVARYVASYRVESRGQ